MTIQRQYVLPNCSLVLEGLSADTSNQLSILANAEFKLVGIEQPISGGMEFFKALINAVSAYCQRLISGLDHPEHTASQSSLVVVEPDDGQYHRLTFKSGVLADSSDTETSEAQTIKISTVQLFDMAEAIDQFCADSQALPDVSMPLAPLPRKYVKPAEPLVQRALPPLLGVGTLAVAALGLFFLPVPELAEPGEPQNAAALEEPVSTDPVASDPPDLSEGAASDATETVSDQSSEPRAITDNAQLAALQQQVQQQIEDALSEDTALEQPLSYQISVADDGDIVSYNHLDDASLENLDSTPLPTLTYIPVGASEAVATFEVTFATDGTVEVSTDQSVVTPETVIPDVVPSEVEITAPEEDQTVQPEASQENPSEDTSNQSSTPTKSANSTSEVATADLVQAGELSAFITTPIQDVDRIYTLNQELRRTIINNRDPDRSGPEARYRIRLDEEGNVTGYKAANDIAEQDAASFKIPDLVKPTPGDQPQLDFLVVIDDDNVVEVSPWDGWP